MNTIQNRIDRSVNFFTENTLVNSSKNYIPLFPISTAEKLKAALVKRFSADYPDVAPRLVYQSVNEAYALVSLTSEPLLFLPALAEEKVQGAAAWSAHQRSVRDLHPLALVA